MRKSCTLLLWSLTLLLSHPLNAQIIVGVKYQIMNSLDLALAHREGHLVIATPSEDDEMQQWSFEAQPDGNYALYNEGAKEYVFLGTSNGWDAVFSEDLPSDVMRGEYNVEALDDGNLAIKLAFNNKYLGTDEKTDGSWVFLDKQPSNNGHWKLIQLTEDEGPAALYQKLETSILDYVDKNFEGIDAIVDEVSDQLMEYSNTYADTGNYDEGIVVLGEYSKRLSKAYKNISSIEELLEEIALLLETTDYPGKSTFLSSYNESQSKMESKELSIDFLLDQPQVLELSIGEYKLSQMEVATAESPADLSMYITHPSFRVEMKYSSESTTSDEGWTYECLPEKNGDYGARHKYADETGKNLTCFNAWSTNFSSMNLYQTIEGLPDGKYKVECIGWCSEDNNNDQHAYIKNSAGVTAVSANATKAMTTTEWERFTSGEVVVTDGKVTIGFASTSEGGPAGWFLVTDFKLLYTGMYTMNELNEICASMISEAEGMSTPLKGDQQILEDALTSVKSATELETLKEAEVSLGIATTRVKTSNEKYNTFVENVLNPLHTQLESTLEEKAHATLSKVNQYVIERLSSDDIMHEEIDELTALIEAYVNYVNYQTDIVSPVLEESEKYDPDAIRDLQACSDEQWQQANDDLSKANADALYWSLRELTERVKQTHVAGEDADMSFLIKNAGLEEGNDWWNNYWTVDKMDTQSNMQSNKGDHYSGNPENRYLNARGNGILTEFNAYQTVTGLPNGTYLLRAACRADAADAYLYALNSEGTLYKQQIIINSDAGGSLYESALEKALNEASILTGKPIDELYASGEYDCPVPDAGWDWNEVKGIEVVDHTLTIGIATTASVTGSDGYTGSLISGDDFQLIYVKAGDNSDIEYVSGIAKVMDDSSNGKTGIYDLQGRRIKEGAKLNRGIYLINGKKVFVNSF